MRNLNAGVISSFLFLNLINSVAAQEFIAPPPGADPNSFGPPEINQPNPTNNPSINITPFSNTSQCGLSIYGNFQNTDSETITELGFVFNTNPCRNETRIERVRGEFNLRQKEIDLLIQNNTECLWGRTQAVVAGRDPDLVCSKPF